MVCLFSAPTVGFPKHFCATSKIFSLKALAILDRSKINIDDVLNHGNQNKGSFGGVKDSSLFNT